MISVFLVEEPEAEVKWLVQRHTASKCLVLDVTSGLPDSIHYLLYVSPLSHLCPLREGVCTSVRETELDRFWDSIVHLVSLDTGQEHWEYLGCLLSFHWKWYSLIWMGIVWLHDELKPWPLPAFSGRKTWLKTWKQNFKYYCTWQTHGRLCVEGMVGRMCFQKGGGSEMSRRVGWIFVRKTFCQTNGTLACGRVFTELGPLIDCVDPMCTLQAGNSLAPHDNVIITGIYEVPSVHRMFYKYLIWFSQQSHKIGAVISSVLPMRKLRQAG